jgi:hypothetical protein
MKKALVFSLVAGFLLIFKSIDALAVGEVEVNQANLCEVNEWRVDLVAAVCEPGQKVVFLPQQFGNEQLPVIFAAVNCDLRFSVALTKGAVSCIYQPIAFQMDE